MLKTVPNPIFRSGFGAMGVGIAIRAIIGF